MICRHFGVCGGCSVPGVAYQAQLDRKQEQLRSWFPHLTRLPMVASPIERGFRHKVAFVFAPGTSGARLVMGHYQAQSRQVVPVHECPVHSDLGNRLAFALRDRLAASRLPPNVLRHVLIRTTDDEREAVMMLVVTSNHKALRAPIRAFLESAGAPDGFFLNVNDRPDDAYMVGRETIRLAGRSHVREDMLGTSFLISPTAFFQTNVQAARALLRLVLDHVGPVSRILDLYSGSGLFALPLARRGSRVVAIEENRQAVKDAEANLRLNGIPAGGVRFIAARVEDALVRVNREPFDAIVLDPPRQGCPDAVIDRVCALAAPRIVYVSCNPERLAGEQRRFRQHGYLMTEMQGVDMFPHTEHIETVSMFTRQSGHAS
jgi:23S rRNA (uracil1939-C5)-methyltransferase